MILCFFQEIPDTLPMYSLDGGKPNTDVLVTQWYKISSDYELVYNIGIVNINNISKVLHICFYRLSFPFKNQSEYYSKFGGCYELCRVLEKEEKVVLKSEKIYIKQFSNLFKDYGSFIGVAVFKETNSTKELVFDANLVKPKLAPIKQVNDQKKEKLWPFMLGLMETLNLITTSGQKVKVTYYFISDSNETEIILDIPEDIDIVSTGGAQILQNRDKIKEIDFVNKKVKEVYFRLNRNSLDSLKIVYKLPYVLTYKYYNDKEFDTSDIMMKYKKNNVWSSSYLPTPAFIIVPNQGMKFLRDKLLLQVQELRMSIADSFKVLIIRFKPFSSRIQSFIIVLVVLFILGFMIMKVGRYKK